MAEITAMVLLMLLLLFFDRERVCVYVSVFDLLLLLHLDR